MKPAPFDYARPSSVAEACRILSEAGGGATVIAGGQTLMPLLNLRMSQPFILVDINRIPELTGVSRVTGGIRVGPMTRQADALVDATLARHLPAMVTALGHVGHYQTRNRGTVGGSVALGEPAAEMPATAVALGATLEIASVRGSRTVAATDFYIGPYMTVLESDELLTGIVYPDWPEGHLVLFREVAQRPGDFALVGMVGCVVLDGGVVSRAGLAWFGMGPTPIRMRRAEAALIGRSLSEIDPGAVAELAVADAAPFDDHHASAEYRRTVGRRIFARTLRETLDLRDAA
ncbi:xanthine dehydrogenase family protein subunit M [Novosphingobium sp. ST904]|uniref:FAD binding domain-containing protein n=1 Tax=Novosphingobium sp. ST904 TaxID=1684385 RepID=UPI0006C861FA|nr:xanthine dehydrogenase family protein subunit M [Novosphingobium sp. ST904]KPH60299.1 molybdopterin dehydrogenase [Novosphingobium sp. ST904]TCM36802.1 carbon-monoxide dehydrogenase medium subunit [Novosphingobium sp. ST904]